VTIIKSSGYIGYSTQKIEENAKKGERNHGFSLSGHWQVNFPQPGQPEP